ncbi:phosphorylase [Metarhizium robertsii]|uniref:Phosphorylase n=1 Tax=Metarhizium robertsii TaxID=568076 RepID=A0A014NFR5_9HYPO|nr:phosphorylase [Metarhizium robertsii]
MQTFEHNGGFRSGVLERESDDRYGDRYPRTRSEEAQWNQENRAPGDRGSPGADTIRRSPWEGHERNHPSMSQEPSAQDRAVSPPPVAPSAPAFGSVPSCTGSNSAFIPAQVCHGFNLHHFPTIPPFVAPAQAQQSEPETNWPEPVRDYVKRSFLPFNNDPSVSRAEVDATLAETITTAAKNRTLYTTQLYDIPLSRTPWFESVVGSGKRTSSDFSHGGSSQNSPYCSTEPTEPATLELTILSGQSGLGHQRDGREGDQEFEQWRPFNNDEDSNSRGSSNGARSNYSTNSEQVEGVSCTGEFGYEAQFSDDADSIYTADPDVPLSKKNANIFWLADDLFNKAFTEKPDEDGLDRIEKLLPQLLKTFAIKVGSGGSTQIYRDVMVFVRRHRSEITKAMRDRYNEENNLRSDVLGNNVTRIDPGDLVRHWRQHTDTLEDLNIAPNEISEDISDYIYYEDLDEADPAADSLPELSVYKDFISKLPEYKWLLERIQGALYMDDAGNVQTNIRNTILQLLPRAKRISREAIPQTHYLTFTADWDLCEFLQEQDYLDSPERTLERAITIIGSETDAQAATTTEYLGQTWPSSGIHLLHAVKAAMQDTCPGRSFFWSLGPCFKLGVAGIAESIAEIGEQLAWLGSALRSSPYQTGIAVVNAFVSRMWTSPLNGVTQRSEFFCNINFNLDAVDGTGEIPNGQCWHDLFRNPVIVKGYPIPRRPLSNMGLEIRLDTMAHLAGTRHIQLFNNKIFIKGFSIMLVPTRHSDNILVWHLLFKKNGNRISYLDNNGPHIEETNLFDLETNRHILGWSSSVRYLTGAADANYVIESSWLKCLHENCNLSGKVVTPGRLIKSDHAAALGKRDVSLQVSGDTYRKKLYALSKEYVVLWDVECKRGWLVNGVNALLHLLRASLEFNKSDDLSFGFLFQSDKFREAKNPYTVSAALEVLLNASNLDMELYEEDEKDESNASIKYRIRDRVNDLYGTLEKLIDYQRSITGERLKSSPRKDLEGWDFKDIATNNENPIYPCLAKLKTIGKGWVDFIRALKAVTVFGRNFGALLDPVPDPGRCKYWKTLPLNKYYLAASMEDLSRIMSRLGDPRANPPLLIGSIVWYPSKIATRCSCSADSDGTVKHRELAQVLWPSHIGDPDKGEPPLSGEESDDDPADSGIGSSVRLPTEPESQGHSPTSSSSGIHALQHEHYRIGIICALPKELKAVRTLLDSHHQDLPRRHKDMNTYVLGCLGGQNIVAACLPYEDYGTNAASKVASDMGKSFTNLKWYFVVGIGGGIPSEKHNIRLGDVVVGTSVIQHDMGKAMQKDTKFLSTGIVKPTATELRTVISLVESERDGCQVFMETCIEFMSRRSDAYKKPEQDHDKLFEPHAIHEDGQETCRNCKGSYFSRATQESGPRIHYGRIASGNQVIRDAVMRDRIRAQTGALCFEMEGAGVMTTEHCLIVRGICDYADSHKNDEWHDYAAATAAAYTKYFLLRMGSSAVYDPKADQ